MTKTPKSLRLQIGLFGRTNVGKSSVLNTIAGQQVSITSDLPGTTTDVVEKSMELLPVGPVVFLDTAGIDDSSDLAGKRLEKTRLIYRRAEIGVLVTEAGVWGPYEREVARCCSEAEIPLLCIVNKVDRKKPEKRWLEGLLDEGADEVIAFCSVDPASRDHYINDFKKSLIALVPDDYLMPPPLVGDLLPPGGHLMLIVPIDIEAPKGRIILPQVQTIRDALDADTIVTVVKENQYASALAGLRKMPDLVVCDSQVVDLMVRETPEEVSCTTFSTLFSRFKGDLGSQVEGVLALDSIGRGDRVLISESCSHHAMDDDIGRVKIPRWLTEYLGFSPQIDVVSGRDYPENLADYSIIIHCGACMLTRREMLVRIRLAAAAGVAVTNYGIAISQMRGTLGRIIGPFEELGPIAEKINEQDKRRAAV